MRIGVDVRELAGNKAGKGWYVYFILEKLKYLDKKNEYILYGQDKFEAVLPERCEIILIKQKGFNWHLTVLRRLKKDKIQVYFAPTSLIVPAFSKIPTVMTIHDLTVLLFPQKHKLKNRIIENLFTKKAVNNATKILAISHSTKKDLNRYFPMSIDKTRVTELGVSPIFKPLGENKGDATLKNYRIEGNYILFVGTLEPRKNIEAILEAYAKLQVDLKEKYKLVIAGKKGWYYEQIFTKADELGLGEDVIFTGYVKDDDLPAMYGGAGVFIYPSLYEGFGLPVLEAMACGVPVITSNVSSMVEVAGDSAMVVRPNSNEINIALEKLLKDKTLRDKYIELGLERSKLFSWQKTAKITLEVFENIGRQI